MEKIEAEGVVTVEEAKGMQFDRGFLFPYFVNDLEKMEATLTEIPGTKQERDPASTRVGDVMTPSLRTVRETVEIEDALRIMRSGPFRRLPVVDAAGKLVGLMSLDDALQSLAGEFRGIEQLLKQESPESLSSNQISEKGCL